MSLARLCMHRCSAPHRIHILPPLYSVLIRNWPTAKDSFQQCMSSCMIFNTTQLYLSSFTSHSGDKSTTNAPEQHPPRKPTTISTPIFNTPTGQDTYLDNPLLRLNLRICHLAMVNDHRIPARPTPTRPPNAVREPGVRIGEKQLQPVSSASHLSMDRYGSCGTYDIIPLNLIRLSPRTHHKRIVRRQDSNDIDTLFLELREVLDVPGDVLGRAGGGECACLVNTIVARDDEQTNQGRRRGRLSYRPILWRRCS